MGADAERPLACQPAAAAIGSALTVGGVFPHFRVFLGAANRSTPIQAGFKGLGTLPNGIRSRPLRDRRQLWRDCRRFFSCAAVVVRRRWPNRKLPELGKVLGPCFTKTGTQTAPLAPRSGAGQCPLQECHQRAFSCAGADRRR